VNPGCHAVRDAQRRLQGLYALDLRFDAADFLVTAAQRVALGNALGGAPSDDREALWVLEESDDLSVALCLADELLRGADATDDASLDHYCALLEGVSHLLYLLDRARTRRPTTLLEMELQAEVDKFVTTYFARLDARVGLSTTRLLQRLFVDCELTVRACPLETQRYRAANRMAHRYCAYLQSRYLERGQVEPLLSEVRRFWRMGLAEKLRHISGAYTGTRSAA
jgi:hypothetical protein